jgi:hypothetical protein
MRRAVAAIACASLCAALATTSCGSFGAAGGDATAGDAGAAGGDAGAAGTDAGGVDATGTTPPPCGNAILFGGAGGASFSSFALTKEGSTVITVMPSVVGVTMNLTNTGTAQGYVSSATSISVSSLHLEEDVTFRTFTNIYGELGFMLNLYVGASNDFPGTTVYAYALPDTSLHFAIDDNASDMTSTTPFEAPFGNVSGGAPLHFVLDADTTTKPSHLTGKFGIANRGQVPFDVALEGRTSRVDLECGVHFANGQDGGPSVLSIDVANLVGYICP